MSDTWGEETLPSGDNEICNRRYRYAKMSGNTCVRDFPEEDVLRHAATIAQSRLSKVSDALSSPGKVRRFLQTIIGYCADEQLYVILLDNRHRVIHHRVLFKGTIDGSAVYPRVLLRLILRYNGAAVLLAHAHPSGVCEPSEADIAITKKIKDACSLIDVRLLDHLIVSPEQSTSLAERGLM